MVVAAAFLLCFWAIALVVLAIDPLDLYPWGATVRLKDTDYSLAGAPYAITAALKDPANDALLIGGSSSYGFTREMLTAELPGIRHAFNLSYGAPRAFDRGVVDKMVLRYAQPKRVLLGVDFFYITGPPAGRTTEKRAHIPPQSFQQPD